MKAVVVPWQSMIPENVGGLPGTIGEGEAGSWAEARGDGVTGIVAAPTRLRRLCGGNTAVGMVAEARSEGDVQKPRSMTSSALVRVQS